jgi:hypothetical protein
MTKDNERNRIGYRYLFDSKGCSLSSHQDATINLIVSQKYNVKIYFGPKPQYGIQIVSDFSKYIVPGKTASFGTIEFKRDANQSSKYGPFFLEIVVSTKAGMVVSDDGTIRDLLLKQAETRTDEFRNVINLVAGIIGLRFHRQFVLELLNEEALAWEGEVPIRGFAGPVLENLELLPLNDNGIEALESLGKKFTTLSPETVRELGLLFHWLLRAWHERDNLYSFIDLFIPLECILGKSKITSEDKRRAKSIRILINKHAGECSKDLYCFFDKIFQHSGPTLDESFIDLAKTAKLPGWQADIEAFRKFRRMRNELLHGADKDVQQNLSIGDKEVRTLSDLVERYVNYFLFRDNKVYRSRWRPKIRETINNENT